MLFEHGLNGLFFHYHIEICIWSLRVEDFVAVHDCYEVLGVTQVDDVVGVAGKHDDGPDFVAGDLVFDYFVRALLLIAKLD